jgi:hypothetical protein
MAKIQVRGTVNFEPTQTQSGKLKFNLGEAHKQKDGSYLYMQYSVICDPSYNVHASKDNYIIVDGTMSYQQYLGKDGNMKSSYTIFADSVASEPKQRNNGGFANNGGQAQAAQSHTVQKTQNNPWNKTQQAHQKQTHQPQVQQVPPAF